MNAPLIKIGDVITIDGFKGEVQSIQKKQIVLRGEDGESRGFTLLMAETLVDSQ